MDLADYRQALTYLFQAKNIYDKIAGQLSPGGAQQFPPYGLSNIGKAYEKLNIIDSALYFQRLALNYPVKMIYELQADILVGIGNIEKRQKNLSNALTTFRKVLNITFWEMPLPLSLTFISTLSPIFFVLTETVGS